LNLSHLGSLVALHELRGSFFAVAKLSMLGLLCIWRRTKAMRASSIEKGAVEGPLFVKMLFALENTN
jgi:hypothetical protein